MDNISRIGSTHRIMWMIGFSQDVVLQFLQSHSQNEIVIFTHTRPDSVDWLCDMFLSRLHTYSIGNQSPTGAKLHTLIDKYGKDHVTPYDILYINSSVDYGTENLNYFIARNYSQWPEKYPRQFPIIYWDNYSSPHRKMLWDGYVRDGHIMDCSMNYTKGDFKIGQMIHSLKIGMICVHSGDEYKRKTRYGKKSKLLYCKKQGYDYCDDPESYDIDRPPTWSKIKMFEKFLPMYDYILCVDADCFVMNPDYRIEKIIALTQDRDMAVCRDWKTISTAGWLVRNSQWSFDFLRRLYEIPDWIHKNYHEQSTLVSLYHKKEMDADKHIMAFPLDLERLMHAYWFTWKPGDFLLQFNAWNAMGRLHEMNNYCPIRMDEDTDESYKQRMETIKNLPQIAAKELTTNSLEKRYG